MRKLIVAGVIGIAISGPTAAQQKVAHIGDFETGQVQRAEDIHDGFYIRTLPDPQTGIEAILSSLGGFGPATALDTKVVGSEVVGSETVRPRSGKFFLRSAIYYNKDYTEVNNGVLDKPRSTIALGNAAHRIDYDEEVYTGFSIYTPLNYEHETGVRDDRGSIMLLSVNADTSRTFFTINQFVQAPSNQAHWWLNYYTSDSSTNEDGAVRHLIDLGPVVPDLGKWTDFVIRFRANPFSVDTNPATKGIPGAMNQTFQGNRGIIQVWKSEGTADQNGNRKMALKVDKVNSPVGLVPHATDKMLLSWRIYKFGWKRNPTTVKGPVWFGFDEIRHGMVARDGTTYDDVMPGEARAAVDVVPEPPRNVAVN